MLLILGRLDEAEDLASEGLTTLPANIEILAQSAGVRIAREDWFGALARIGEIEAQAPLLPEVTSHIATMRHLVTTQIDALPTSLPDR